MAGDRPDHPRRKTGRTAADMETPSAAFLSLTAFPGDGERFRIQPADLSAGRTTERRDTMKKLFSLLLVLAVALSSAGAMGEALPAPAHV